MIGLVIIAVCILFFIYIMRLAVKEMRVYENDPTYHGGMCMLFILSGLLPPVVGFYLDPCIPYNIGVVTSSIMLVLDLLVFCILLDSMRERPSKI